MWGPDPSGVLIRQQITYTPLVSSHSHVPLQSSPHGLSYLPKEWTRQDPPGHSGEEASVSATWELDVLLTYLLSPRTIRH